jgi:hypothetical protein
VKDVNEETRTPFIRYDMQRLSIPYDVHRIRRIRRIRRVRKFTIIVESGDQLETSIKNRWKGHYPLLGIISSRKRGFCLAPHTFTWGYSLARLGGLTLLFVQGRHKKEFQCLSRPLRHAAVRQATSRTTTCSCPIFERE